MNAIFNAHITGLFNGLFRFFPVARRLLASAVFVFALAGPGSAMAQWTSYVSEEYPPIGCNAGGAVNGVQCSGGYCDNLAAYCSYTGTTTIYSRTWSSYFSEESTNYRYCGGSGYITGFACRGGYCDSISIECTEFYGLGRYGCYWTGWVSEEYGGYLYFPYGYYAAGMQCSGSYCDSKRFYICAP